MIPLGNAGASGVILPLDVAENKGVVWWIGTYKNTQAFSNPHSLGLVTASWIGDGSGVVAQTVDRIGGVNVHTSNTANSWWKIDLGATRLLSPTYMRCQNRTGYSDQVPQNVTIAGSSDNINWTTVGGVTPGTWNGTASAWNTITLNPLAGNFRYFRYLFTSTNSSSAWYICIQEYELFGTLYE